jgi:Na+/H+-translocating membrane pyrophosphatase
LIALQLLPVVLSLIVLAAHFLRGGNMVMVMAALVLLGLLALPRRWVAQLVQVALILGAVEWVRTLIGLVMLRSGNEQPVLRMAFILGVVAILTASSALVFRIDRMRKRYGQVQVQTSGKDPDK